MFQLELSLLRASLLLSETGDSFQKAKQHFKTCFIFLTCSMSDPAPSTCTWVVFSTAANSKVTYSQATAAGSGGGGVTVSNFDPNVTAITEQPHKRRG